MSSSTCPGCGVVLPDADGPTHAYLQASPACWQAYQRVMVVSMEVGPGAVDHVDPYGVQHPGGAEHDLRQRRSVAVHLVALCLVLECGVGRDRLATHRGRASATVLPTLGLDEWPHLAPPRDPGWLTVADVRPGEEHAASVADWAASAWAGWASHHDTVRTWAGVALDAARRR